MSEHTKPKPVSRRSFAAVLAGTGAAAPLLALQQTTPPPTAPAPTQAAGLPTQGASPQRPGRPPEIPPFQDPIEFVRKDVAPRLQPFPMTQVRLLAGPFHDAQEWNRGYMSRLPADRLTHNFRLNAGLPSSAKPLGGWERYVDPKLPRTNQDGELRGHFTGHFLSASAQLWASTGDREAKAKGDEMVDALAKCQAKLGAGGYLSAFPTEFFDRLDARRGVWAPFYTVHKIMAGMFDMYRYAGNKQALEVASGMADWADRWTASKTEEHMQDILRTEYGGMGEALYNLAAETGNEKWARAGDRYSKKSFFNPLASRRDELRGLHVNTHIPQAISAARRYEVSGDVRFHDVADYFWDEVVGARSYVTTGTSNAEGWQSQPRQLAWELKNTAVRNSQPSPNTAECCCAYNMLKLTRHLYSWTAQPRYFDYYERSLLNQRLGTIEPNTGHTEYYLSLALNGARKNFNSDFDDFWCCTGTGVEEYSKLNDSIYWRDERGIYVNLFIASELNWEEKGFKLRQDTKFPQQPATALVVTAARPVHMAIRLRVPGWLASAPVVKLNGKAIEASAEPGSYLTLARIWKTGDRLEMELPMRLSMEILPDDASLQSFLYGPVVLAADLGAAPPRRAPGEGGAPQQRPQFEAPTFKAAGLDSTAWVKPGDGPLAFHTSGQAKDYPLVPLNSLFDKRYLVYLKVA